MPSRQVVWKPGKCLLIFSLAPFFNKPSRYSLSLGAQNLKHWSRPALKLRPQQDPQPCLWLLPVYKPARPLSTGSLVFQKASLDHISLPLHKLSRAPITTKIPTSQPDLPSPPRGCSNHLFPVNPLIHHLWQGGRSTELHSHTSWASAHSDVRLHAFARTASSGQAFLLTPWMGPSKTAHLICSFSQETEPQRPGTTGLQSQARLDRARPPPFRALFLDHTRSPWFAFNRDEIETLAWNVLIRLKPLSPPN